MFVVVIFHLFCVIVKKLCCVRCGTKREVIPVKYGRELTLTLTRYMHPLQPHFKRNDIIPLLPYFMTTDLTILLYDN